MQINLIDKSFKLENAAQYELSLQIDRDLLSYCVFFPQRKQHVAFRNYKLSDIQLLGDLTRQLTDIFLKEEILVLPFRKVRLIYYSQHSTLVPDHYFDDSYARDYYAFNHSLEPGDEIFSNFIPSRGAWNVFSIPSPVVSLLNDQFNHRNYVHQATPFLLPVVNRQKLKNSISVNAGINRDFFDVAVFHDDRLLLYNTYPYINETDLLYYVLYVYKEMALKPDTTPLFISGEMSTKLLYYDTLKQYIPGLAHANTAGTFAFAPALYSISVYKFLNLLTVHNCVLSVENTREGKLR